MYALGKVRGVYYCLGTELGMHYFWQFKSRCFQEKSNFFLGNKPFQK